MYAIFKSCVRGFKLSPALNSTPLTFEIANATVTKLLKERLTGSDTTYLIEPIK